LPSRFAFGTGQAQRGKNFARQPPAPDGGDPVPELCGIHAEQVNDVLLFG
jgi:hypothetical protein